MHQLVDVRDCHAIKMNNAMTTIMVVLVNQIFEKAHAQQEHVQTIPSAHIISQQIQRNAMELCAIQTKIVIL